MSRAPRSIDEYLKQLRSALEGADPALIQDALYDAEEYLRAELAAHPGKSEGDVLELIASTYGAPEEVAAAYRDTEAKVNAALRPVVPNVGPTSSPLRRFFGVYSDPRAYTSLFYLLLTLVTGIAYFTFVVAGLSISLGLAVLIVGVPFFLAFIGIARAIALGEGRLLEAVTGERMPRRPVHPGPKVGWGRRIVEMLSDLRTWTTLAYLLLMMPIGIVYFTIAIAGVSIAGALVAAPFANAARHMEILPYGDSDWSIHPAWLGSPLGLVICVVAGIVILTIVMHAARSITKLHVGLARRLLVTPGT